MMRSTILPFFYMMNKFKIKQGYELKVSLSMVKFCYIYK